MGGENAEHLHAESEIEGVAHAPSFPAHLERGILYQCPWRIPMDGTGRHCRVLAKALAAAGVAVQIDDSGPRSLQFSSDLPHDARAIEYLTHTNFQRTELVIKHAVLVDAERLRQQLLPVSTGFVDESVIQPMLDRTILYVPLERNHVEPAVVALLNRIAQVWVPCESNATALIASGVDSSKVKIIPYCYDPHEEHVESRKGDDGKETTHRFPSVSSIPMPFGHEDVPDGRRFYTIGRWESRKNQHRLIGAFLQAFKPKDRASLLVRSSSPFKNRNYPTPEESVAYWLENEVIQKRGWTIDSFNRHVRIMQKKLPESDIVEIHRKNNIYVSSGRGEGWDIPAFEAKLAGNKMIYTDWGGPRDFACDGDVALPFSWAPCDPEYNWDPASQWAEIQTEALIEALRTTQPPKARWQDRSLHAKFNLQAVGDRMRFALHKILRDLEGSSYQDEFSSDLVPNGWG
jgi:glycosyltransferase involved in cell wall biosynthesis